MFPSLTISSGKLTAVVGPESLQSPASDLAIKKNQMGSMGDWQDSTYSMIHMILISIWIIGSTVSDLVVG